MIPGYSCHRLQRQEPVHSHGLILLDWGGETGQRSRLDLNKVKEAEKLQNHKISCTRTALLKKKRKEKGKSSDMFHSFSKKWQKQTKANLPKVKVGLWTNWTQAFRKHNKRISGSFQCFFFFYCLSHFAVHTVSFTSSEAFRYQERLLNVDSKRSHCSYAFCWKIMSTILHF